MSIILALTTIGAALTSGACTLTPAAILSELDHEPRHVVQQLWDGGACEDALLSGLASGQAQWLNVAVALRPHTDAWASESIPIMLGYAMLRAPSRVLPMVGRYGFGDEICFPWDIDDSPEGLARTQHDMAVALPMFKRFTNTGLSEQASRCLVSLQAAIERNPDLWPNKALHRSRGAGELNR